MENKTGKYIKYAIGEIVLVVIGILIALGINNWNNERISKKELKKVYKQIQTDLKVDTLAIAGVIKNYEEKDIRIQNIIDGKIGTSFYDTINSLNYKDCKICLMETTSLLPFGARTKGYTLLKNISSINNYSSDSLSNKIINLYTYGVPRIKENLSEIRDITFDNIKRSEQYPWFVDWIERNYNKEFLIYIFESQTYRNQLVRYRIYYKSNYIKFLKLYKKLASEILEQIEKELNKK